MNIDKYYSNIELEDYGLRIFGYVIGIILWTYITSISYTNLDKKTSFIPVFIIISIYPFIQLLSSIWRTIKGYNTPGYYPNIQPDELLCYDLPDNLTTREKALGIVGKINYKCHKEKHNLIMKKFGDISYNSFLLVSALFGFVLYLVTQKSNNIVSSLIKKENAFLSFLIRYTMLFSVIIFTSIVLSNEYQISELIFTYVHTLYILQGASIALILFYILYKLLIY